MSKSHLPWNWQEIGLGDLVVAQQSREGGWYEAIVVEANGAMLTLRWRDYRANDEMSANGFPPGRGTLSPASRDIRTWPLTIAGIRNGPFSSRLARFSKENESLGRFSKARSQSEAMVNDDVTFQTFAQEERRCDATRDPRNNSGRVCERVIRSV